MIGGRHAACQPPAVSPSTLDEAQHPWKTQAAAMALSVRLRSGGMVGTLAPCATSSITGKSCTRGSFIESAAFIFGWQIERTFTLGTRVPMSFLVKTRSCGIKLKRRTSASLRASLTCGARRASRKSSSIALDGTRGTARTIPTTERRRLVTTVSRRPDERATVGCSTLFAGKETSAIENSAAVLSGAIEPSIGIPRHDGGHAKCRAG
jgi:hypothetical protein